MSGVIRSPQGRHELLAPDPAICQIDWSHPLSVGIRHLIVGRHDLARNKMAIVANDGVAGATGLGAGVFTSTSSNNLTFSSPKLLVAGDLTIWMGFLRQGTDANATINGLISKRSPSSTSAAYREIEIRLNQSDANTSYTVIGGVGTTNNLGPVAAPNDFGNMVFTRRASGGAISYYKDGLYSNGTTGITGTSISGTAGTEISIGHSVTFTNGVGGYYTGAYVWDRELSAQEIVEISRAPFQVLRR